MFVHGFLTLMVAAVVLGGIYQAAHNPTGANTLVVATGDTINGVTKGLEGR